MAVLTVSPQVAATPPGTFGMTLDLKLDNPQPLNKTTGTIVLSSVLPVKHTVVSIRVYDCISDYAAVHPVYQTAFSAVDMLPEDAKKLPLSLPINTMGMYRIEVRADGDRQIRQEQIYPSGLYTAILLRSSHKAAVLRDKEFKEWESRARRQEQNVGCGKPNAGLRSVITPLRQIYRKGEPLGFRIGLENVSNVPIRITELPLGRFEWLVSISAVVDNVRTEDGQLALHKGIGVRFRIAGPFFENGSKTLAPGETWTKEIWLSDKKELAALAKWPRVDFRARHDYSVSVLPFFEEEGKQKLWHGFVCSEDRSDKASPFRIE
jgi:hypothetical protein